MTLKTTQLTAITAASCSAKPASCDADAITLKQVCSDRLSDPQALPRYTGSPVAPAPLTTICPNHRYCLLDDGMGELAFVSAGAWAAAMYHADSGAGADSLCVSRSRST